MWYGELQGCGAELGSCLPACLPPSPDCCPCPTHAAVPLLLLCADTGGLVETANERARLALWFGLQVRLGEPAGRQLSLWCCMHGCMLGSAGVLARVCCAPVPTACICTVSCPR